MEIKPKADARDAALISRAALGDLEAFNELVATYQDLTYNLTYALLGDRESAEDATQEAFVSAFQHMGSFRGSSFRSWLLRIAANACYDVLRALRRHPTVPLFPEDAEGAQTESPLWLTDPRPSVQAEIERREVSQIIYRRLDELPAGYRSVITLVDLHEIDYAEAAHALGIPIGTVKSRLARARYQMRRKLSEDRISLADFGLGKAPVAV